MLFNSLTYLLFLPTVVVLYWATPKRFRKALLVVASYVFYMHWMPAYGILIFSLTLVNYFIGLRLPTAAKESKKPLLIAGLVFNLGCLCFFKYTNFLLESLWQVLRLAGNPFHQASLASTHSPTVNIILPLGISFFTFEFIHYITDVYKGSNPVRNFKDFALFAAFFPSQIAGPIKRFQDFVAQLAEETSFTWIKFHQGMYLILRGFVRKVVLADNLAQVVNTGFNNAATLGTADAWLAVMGFGFELYFDFAGYTDIGRGSALLFGFKVPENFNAPFLATNPKELWHRWHMSLSTWLRDYLFIPLGGSRGGVWRTRTNNVITMTLGGLWHGAAWHFVLWGFLHGLALVVYKQWSDVVEQVPILQKMRTHLLWHWSGIVMTCLFFCLVGILFRATSIEQSYVVFSRLLCLAPSAEVSQIFWQSTLPFSLSVYIVFAIWQHWAPILEERMAAGLFAGWLSWAKSSLSLRIVSYASVAIIVVGFSPFQVVPFIYFQF